MQSRGAVATRLSVKGLQSVLNGLNFRPIASNVNWEEDFCAQE